jgi:hypothetical protein
MADIHPSMARLYEFVRSHFPGVQTQSELGRWLNTSPQVINNWEMRGISKDGAIAIQAEKGINATWLREGTGQPDLADRTNLGWTNVDATTQGVSLGGGSALEEYVETHQLKFRESSLRGQGLREQDLEVYYGRGDSMEPRIKDGDAILVNKAETRIIDDKVYFIRHEGHYFVKRLQTQDDMVFIVSENRDHPQWRKPVLVRPNDDFEVLGRVRWIGSWEN